MEQEPNAFTPFKMIANPAWRFFNFYIIRGGFRDGGRGLYAAMTAAFYVFLKYAKLYERTPEIAHWGGVNHLIKCEPTVGFTLLSAG